MHTDLRGRPVISYLRFSSTQQGRETGSTIDRQQGVLDKILSTYGLVLDHSLTDRGKSASKGIHRTKGYLGVLLEMLKRGEIAHGTVLAIEAIDRLTREPFLVSIDMIKNLIDGGMLIITGDLTIWDRESINSAKNFKLVAELNAAYDYAKRLSEMASGGHEKRRKRIQEGHIPNLNGKVSGWITRTPGKSDYQLHPEHTKTIKLIFDLCIQGFSVSQISTKFNNEKQTLLPGMRAWTVGRIGQILRDRHVLGKYTPIRRTLVKGKIKIIPVGAEVQALPAAIDAATWLAAANAMDSRAKLVGRRGDVVPNLFTGKIFCKTCFSPMRVDTGGGIRNGKRKRHLICRSYQEHSGCVDATRYDLNVIERPLLIGMVAIPNYVPRKRKSTTDVDSEIAQITLEIENKKSAISALIPAIATSPTLAQTITQLSVDVDRLNLQLTNLTLQQTANNQSVEPDWTKHATDLAFPAVQGDVDARQSLRLMIARVDFHIIVGNPMIIREGAFQSERRSDQIDVLITETSLAYRLPDGKIVQSSAVIKDD